MIRLECQGIETTMDYNELMHILQQSGLPWYMDENVEYPRISIVGYEEDLVILGEVL